MPQLCEVAGVPKRKTNSFVLVHVDSLRIMASAAPSDAILVEIAALKEAYAAKYKALREGAGADDFPLASHADVLAELARIADAGGAVPQGAKKLFHDFSALWRAAKVRLDEALEEENLARQRAQHDKEGRQRADIEALTARVKALQPLWQPCESSGPLDLEQHARGEQRLLEHLVLQVEAQGKMLETLMGLVGAPQPLRVKYPGVEGAKTLLAAGYTPLALRSAGFSVAELRGAGCLAVTMKAAYTLVRFGCRGPPLVPFPSLPSPFPHCPSISSRSQPLFFRLSLRRSATLLQS